MPYTCCVVECFTRRDKEIPRTFHSFPIKRDPELCERWILKVSRQNPDGSLWRPNEYSRICSDHFLPEDFTVGKKIKKLKDDAVPSVFPSYPIHKQSVTPRRPSPKKRCMPAIPNEQVVSMSPRKKIKLDHTYSGPHIEEAVTKINAALATANEKLASKTYELKLMSRKLQRREEKLCSLMNDLNSKNMLNNEQRDIISMNFDEDTLSLIDNELKAVDTSAHGMRYSETLKNFAVTMHFYSAQGYNYLRQFLTLPHPSLIRKWASSVNCLPGFLSEVLATLKKDITPDRKDVAIVFDAMSLKKSYEFDKGSTSYIGSVNYGHMQTGCEETLASEALVFMVVGLKKHFKQPIRYFLINKIDSAMQAQIVRDAITLVTEAGHSVRAVICDGNFTNQSTARILGCKFDQDNMVTFFHADGVDEEVYFVFDVCHLMKNVRNCLKEWGTLKYKTEKIEWRFIEELHKLQNTDNLVMGNKLTGRHINFKNNKMNVRLAAQTFSKSVADAIDHANYDLKHPQFNASSATTNFIRTFDVLFDICNSKNPCAKYTKSPITNYNKLEKFQTLKDAIQYIQQLTDETNKKIISGRRKTGFVGFICSALSVMALSSKLLETESYSFFLTYRLSQDHLESFFSRIRRRGGWNNNPTPLQFKCSLRMLLLKNGVLPSQHANCIDFESTSKVFTEDSGEDAAAQTNSTLHKFVGVLREPSIYHDSVLHYISGFICRKVANKIQCVPCQSKLMASSKEQASGRQTLTQRKDKGGLIFSNDMFNVICAADRSLRKHLTGPEGPIKAVDKQLTSKVFMDVMDSVGSSVYSELWQHSMNCHAIEHEDSHVTQIIRQAVKLFVFTVLHHHQKIINTRYVNNDRGTVRHKLTKSILFLHQ